MNLDILFVINYDLRTWARNDNSEIILGISSTMVRHSLNKSNQINIMKAMILFNICLCCCIPLYTCISFASVTRTRFQKFYNITSQWFSLKSLRFSTRRIKSSSSSQQNVLSSASRASMLLQSGSSSLEVMLNETIPYKLEDIWNKFFLPAQGYK